MSPLSYSRRIHLRSATIFLGLLLAIPVASGEPAELKLTRSADSAVPTGVVLRSLSSVLQDNLVGSSYEDSEQRDELKQQAREFLALRAGRLPAQARERLRASCANGEKSFELNPFCREMVASMDSGSSRNRRPAGRARRPNLLPEILAGRTAALNKADEFDIISALKKVSKYSKLERINREVLESKSCPSPALAAALGFKAEEQFPGEEYRKTAIALYKRASECGESDSVVKARYRLSLILVWANDCESAEPMLGKLTENPDAVDYKSRVLYWRMHCARSMKNEKLYSQMKERLLRDFPLSLHSLFVNGDLADLAIVNPKEPDVLFRSVKRPMLNGAVRAAEALLSLDAEAEAVDMLSEILEKGGIHGEGVREAEPAFQLYVAVLLHRSGDTLKKFQVLAAIFRDNPASISRLTMEMLYPLKRFDVIQAHKAKINPYLVISLVRQESAFNERARSPAGAMGLMQLMPGTARRMEHVSRRELFDAKTNIRLGVKFVGKLLEKYDGDAELALAAYNAGPGKVDDWRKRYPVENRLLFLDLIPFRETREYVASIARNYYWYLRLYGREGGAVTPAKENGREPSSVVATGAKKQGFTIFSF